MVEPINVGFARLELSTLHMYETCYGQLSPYSGQELLQINYIDTDGDVTRINTKDFSRELKKLKTYLTLAIWMKIMEYIYKKTEKSLAIL